MKDAFPPNFSRRVVLAGTSMALVSALALRSAYANTAGVLTIKNSSQFYLTFNVVADEWWNCCDDPKPGTIWGPIGPGASMNVGYLRTDGHGCNGRQGQFSVMPSIPTVLSVSQRFWFDNNAGLAIPSDAPPVNYFSVLTASGDKHYTWEVAPKA